MDFLGNINFLFYVLWKFLEYNAAVVGDCYYFYGTHYLQQNKDERFIAMVLIAMLFHNSAFIGMIIWLVYKYLQAGDVKKKLLINGKVIDNDIIKILMILLTGIIALLGLSVIANFLGSINSVFARYVRLYISGTVHLMPMQVLRRLLCCF